VPYVIGPMSRRGTSAGAMFGILRQPERHGQPAAGPRFVVHCRRLASIR
jgi:hypothetical protein